MIGVNWLANPVGSTFFIILILILFLLHLISSIQVNHVKLVGLLVLNQNEQVIGIRDVGVTDCNLLRFLSKLDSLYEFFFKSVYKDQIVAITCACCVGPITAETCNA